MNHSDRLYSIVLSKRYEMRCLTNSAFLFSGPSGRRKARQKDFLLRKAKVRGSESRDLMRIGRSIGEKKQAFAPKEVSVSGKHLLLFAGNKGLRPEKPGFPIRKERLSNPKSPPPGSLASYLLPKKESTCKQKQPFSTFLK